MADPRPTRITLRLALASAISAVVVTLVCVAGLWGMGDLSRGSEEAVRRQLALLDHAEGFQVLFYQKGFVADYLLTGDRRWLDQLEESRRDFTGWLGRATAGVEEPESTSLLARLGAEYRAYDEERGRAVATFDAGYPSEANALLMQSHVHAEQLLQIFDEFLRTERLAAARTLRRTHGSMQRLAALLVGTSVAGVAAALAVALLLSRQIARPIYQLQLQIESAAQRTRIQLAPGQDGLESLGGHLRSLVEKMEEADAALAEHRRRLAQSEKLSAVGELAAKLAHEILNPLAGMKAAVQLLARQGGAAAETAEALDREIRRVEELVRRLVDYSRPLEPRLSRTEVSRLLEAALEAARPELERARARIELSIDPSLPPLEVDPLLMTQVLANLIANGAQALTGPGTIAIAAAPRVSHGRAQVRIEVRDEGRGIAPEHLPRLFHPFFTTRPGGHGLGLAVSQNIVLEHGGQLDASNRADGRGAVFEVTLPVARR